MPAKQVEPRAFIMQQLLRLMPKEAKVRELFQDQARGPTPAATRRPSSPRAKG